MRAVDVLDVVDGVVTLAGALGAALQGKVHGHAVQSVVVADAVGGSGAAIHGVVALAALERVIAVVAVKDIRAVLAPQVVEPGAASDDVVAAVAGDVVVLAVAGQGVAEVVRAEDVLDVRDGVIALAGVLGAALQGQVHRHAVQSVVETDPVAGPDPTIHDVVAFAALEKVVAAVSVQVVVAAATAQVVGLAIPDEGVVVGAAVGRLDADQRVHAGADGVLRDALDVEIDGHARGGAIIDGLVAAEFGLGAAVENIVALTAFQSVVAALAFQTVAARAAVQVVALGAAGQGVVAVSAVHVGRRAVVAQVVLEASAIDVAAAGVAGHEHPGRGRKRHGLIGEFDVLDVRQGVGALGAADRRDVAVGGDGVGRAQAAVDGGVRTATREGAGSAIAVALDLVVAETAGEPVGAFAAEEQVVAIAAGQNIASEVAAQQVTAEAAAEGVVPGVAGDVVVVGIAGEGVGKSAAPDVVTLEVGEAGARGGFQAGFRIGAEVDVHAAGSFRKGDEDRIGCAVAAIGAIAHADIEGVIAVAAVQGIGGEVGAMLAYKIADQVVAGVKAVTARPAGECVRPKAADEPAAPRATVEDVIAIPSNQDVIAVAAGHHVAEIGPFNGEGFEVRDRTADGGGQNRLAVGREIEGHPGAKAAQGSVD